MSSRRYPKVIWPLAIMILALLLSACAPIQSAPAGGSEGSAAPEEAAMSESVEQTLFINSERVPCVGVAPMMCLQVRESEEEEWQFFYSGIDGFVFVPGYLYEIIVNVTERENAPADASSLLYTLVEVVSKSPAYTGDPVALVGTEWQLRAFGDEALVRYDETLTPVTILFSEEGSVSGNAGCNNFTGGYTDDGTSLTFDPLASTMMMCPEEAMAVEQAFLSALQGTLAYTINGNMLEIVYAAGVLTFQAAGTGPQGAAEGSMGNEMTLFVNSERVPCVGEAPMMCLQVRESEGEDWQFFYSGIDGFYFVPGYMYELIVSVSEVANPPADASSLAYTLVQVVSKTPAYTGEPVSLVGTEWLLRAFGEESTVFYDETMTPVTMLFAEDGSVSGNAGCNRFTGGYTDDGSSLTFGALASTMMMCPDEAMAVEQAFLGALEGTLAFTINGNMLEIVYAAGVLTFEAQETMPAAASEGTPAMDEAGTLDGTSWALTSFDGAMGVDFDAATTPVTMVFEDGGVAGVSGCNNFAGDYTVEGVTITFGMLISTMMMCPDDGMAVEQAYLQALQSGPIVFEIVDDVLLLTTPAGVLTFAAQPGVESADESAPAMDEASPLEGTSWALTSLDGAMGVNFDAMATPVTMLFEEGNVSGVSGCNNYAGGYTVDGMTMTFGMLISTMMMCPDDAMAVEQAYLQALQSGPILFEIVGDMLTFTTPNGILTYVDDSGMMHGSDAASEDSAAMSNSLSLDETEWTLVSMDEAMGVEFDPSLVTVKVTFLPDGSVSGNAGCNNFFGSYTHDDVSITFGPLGSTRMLCPDPIMAVERAVSTAVQGGVQYVIEGNTLTLTTANGVLVFEG